MTKSIVRVRIVILLTGLGLLWGQVSAFPHGGRLLAQGSSDDEPRLDNPLFEFDQGREVLFVRFDVTNGQQFNTYRVSVIDKDNIRVGEAVAEAGLAPPIIVAFDNYVEGDYTIRIQALDTAGTSLASVEDKFRHTPPAAPGRMATLLNSLTLNIVFPIAIGLIVLVVAVFLILTVRNAKRTTGTPILQNYGLPAQQEASVALDRTGMYHLNEAPTDGRSASIAVNLKITVYPNRQRVGEKHKVTQFPYTIGRGECDLSLVDDASVSRLHAQITLDQGRVGIVDLMSSNGTYVNGKRIAAEQLFELEARKTTIVRLGGETQITLKPI